MGDVILGFGVFFLVWVGFAYLGKSEGWSSTIRWGGGFIFSVLFSTIAVPFALHRSDHIGKVEAKSISNIEEANKFLLGTWTFTEKLNPNDPYIAQWEKWIIKKDGIAEVYSAFPTDDGWGIPKSQNYEILTSKYTDTGKRFYFIRLKDMYVSANIVDDDLLGFTISASPPVPMRRGDRNPFSK